MKVFIWRRLDNVSYNYHTEGGLVVVAETLEAAVVVAESQGENICIGDAIPDYTYETSPNAEPIVIVFPDAGCC